MRATVEPESRAPPKKGGQCRSQQTGDNRVGLALRRRDQLTDNGDEREVICAKKKPRAGRADAGQNSALGLGGKLSAPSN
jgi:hypothetical protein